MNGYIHGTGTSRAQTLHISLAYLPHDFQILPVVANYVLKLGPDRPLDFAVNIVLLIGISKTLAKRLPQIIMARAGYCQGEADSHGAAVDSFICKGCSKVAEEVT